MTWIKDPINQRRWALFRANKRGFYASIIFLFLFLLSLGAEFLANDKPIYISYKGEIYTPILFYYPETTFGGEFDLEPDYKDPFIQDLIKQGDGKMIWPLIPFSYDTHDLDLNEPAPAPPSSRHWLGTDDQQRDVLARLIYGFRISVLFGILLTLISSFIGVIAGAIQGYLGGWVDLLFQRFVEIWNAIPYLYLLIILSAVFTPGFWILLAIMAATSWVTLVGVVRAEFLRARNFEYVRAARALGVSDRTIMTRHILPNAMVATLTFMPFILNAGITTLTSLDFLGLGMPAGSASLGELLRQGKNNLEAPWLAITGFVVIALTLSLLVFFGEAVRDALDPRKTFQGSDS